jgi:hypothetical protein
MIHTSPARPHLPSALKLLLQAALFPIPEAAIAFGQWRKQIDFESLDLASYNLMPKLYQNLHAHFEKDDITQRIKGIYRRTWLENQLLFPLFEKIFCLFENNRIEFIVLSGAPLFRQFGGDSFVFPLKGFEISVSSEQFPSALEILQNNGWQTKQEISSGDLTENNFLFVDDESQAQFYLRRQPLNQFKVGYQTAERIEFAKTKIKILSANEQILHLCKDEFLGWKKHSGYWALMSFTILKSGTKINWKKLVAQAKARKLSFALFEMLDYTAENLAVEIPEIVLKELAKPQTALLQKWERILTAYRSLRETHLNNRTKTDSPPSVIGFVKFLRQHWQINSILSVPWQIGKRILR